MFTGTHKSHILITLISWVPINVMAFTFYFYIFFYPGNIIRKKEKSGVLKFWLNIFNCFFIVIKSASSQEAIGSTIGNIVSSSYMDTNWVTRLNEINCFFVFFWGCIHKHKILPNLGFKINKIFFALKKSFDIFCTICESFDIKIKLSLKRIFFIIPLKEILYSKNNCIEICIFDMNPLKPRYLIFSCIFLLDNKNLKLKFAKVCFIFWNI